MNTQLLYLKDPNAQLETKIKVKAPVHNQKPPNKRYDPNTQLEIPNKR